MLKWIHHLFNPHCPECKLDRQDEQFNPLVETLRSELASARHQNEQLIKQIIALTSPIIAAPITESQQAPVPLDAKTIPWRVKRQMLETEDRQKAEVLRRKNEELNELEKELDLGKKDALSTRNA